MAGSEHAIAGAGHVGRIQFDVHQLVHALENEHVAVKLDDALVLGERERREFAPAVVEAHIVGEVLGDRWQEVWDVALLYTPGVKGCVALGREGARVENNERILRAHSSERVIQGQETG